MASGERGLGCPKCGQTMTLGFVNPGGFAWGGLAWSDSPLSTGTARPRQGGKVEMLTPRKMSPPNTPGFRCASCRLVLIDYGWAGSQ